MDGFMDSQNAQSRIGQLAKSSYISLTTFKRSGEPIATPVWFAVSTEVIYVTSLKSAWKLKRLARNSSVRIAPCTSGGKVLGETFEGSGRILNGDEAELAFNALKRKYGALFKVWNFFTRGRNNKRFMEFRVV